MDSQIEKRLSEIQRAVSKQGDIRKDDDRPLTVEEAAEYLDVSKSYLYKLTSSEEIPHFKPNGKRIYFLRSDLREYVTRNRVSDRQSQ